MPWLIGLVLALSGMMIVLLALIFSSNEGLLPGLRHPVAPALGRARSDPDPRHTQAEPPTVALR